MDCFEIRNHLHEYIDGSTPQSARTLFEHHLEKCSRCEEERVRIQTLIDTFHKQPRAEMPLEIRESPLSFRIPFLSRAKSWRYFWKELPAAFRLIIEGVSIALVIFLGIQTGPKIRKLYDKSVDDRLEKMIRAEDLNAETIPLTRGKQDSENTAPSESDHFQEDSEVIDPSSANVQVGKGEIWRFNLKTDSPSLIRQEIMKSLKELGLPENLPGMGGAEAPGGIQFDLLIPSATVVPLKDRLQKMAAQPSSDSPFSETFTWYKNHSKNPVPEGKSRVVIWLSQI